jgi:hypothetical protein
VKIGALAPKFYVRFGEGAPGSLGNYLDKWTSTRRAPKSWQNYLGGSYFWDTPYNDGDALFVDPPAPLAILLSAQSCSRWVEPFTPEGKGLGSSVCRSYTVSLINDVEVLDR